MNLLPLLVLPAAVSLPVSYTHLDVYKRQAQHTDRKKDGYTGGWYDKTAFRIDFTGCGNFVGLFRRDVYKRQQGRFTRCKTLGEAYTEEAITERIKGRFAERKPKENRKISLRIDWRTASRSNSPQGMRSGQNSTI